MLYLLKIIKCCLLFGLVAIYYKDRIDIYDGFEASTIKSIWVTSRMEMRSFEIQSQVVRKGESAAKITLRTGDVVEPGNDSSRASERDELEEAEYLESVADNTYEYQFSMFIPPDFPIVSTRLIIAQWKQHCPQISCSDDAPLIALRYQSGNLMITLNNDSGRHYLYKSNKEVRNHWLDFKFRIKFSKENGEITASLNDTMIVNFKGVTSYSQIRGYHLFDNRYYFKIGLYRDRMPEPMTIYIDEYTKKEIIN